MKKIIPIVLLSSLLMACSNNSAPADNNGGPDSIASISEDEKKSTDKENKKEEKEKKVVKEEEDKKPTEDKKANNDEDLTEADDDQVDDKDQSSEDGEDKIALMTDLVDGFNNLPQAFLSDPELKAWQEYAEENEDFPATPKALFTNDGYRLSIGELEFIPKSDDNKPHELVVKGFICNDTDQERVFFPEDTILRLDPIVQAPARQSEQAEGIKLGPKEMNQIEVVYEIDDLSQFDGAMLLEFLYADYFNEEDDNIYPFDAGIFLNKDGEIELETIGTDDNYLEYFMDTSYRDWEEAKAYKNHEHFGNPSEETIKLFDDISESFGTDFQIYGVINENDIEYAFSGPHSARKTDSDNPDNKFSTFFVSINNDSGEVYMLKPSDTVIYDLVDGKTYEAVEIEGEDFLDFGPGANLFIADFSEEIPFTEGYIIKIPAMYDANDKEVIGEMYVKYRYVHGFIPEFTVIDQERAKELIKNS